MQTGCAAVEQRLAQLRRLGDPDFAHRLLVVADGVQLVGEPLRELGALELCHARDRAQVGGGHDPGEHGLVDTVGTQTRDEIEVVLRLEEELRDGEVRLLQLARRPVAIALARGRVRMRLRVGGDADREVADVAHELDQLDGVGQLPGWQVEVGWRVAAETEHVLDPGVAITGDDLDELGARVGGTGEVRHRCHRRRAEDVDHDVVRALARGAAGAVRDRHVGGGQGLELDERGA